MRAREREREREGLMIALPSSIAGDFGWLVG